MNVMIGVDPHKGSHTATMLDRDERELRRIKVRAGNHQVGELLAPSSPSSSTAGPNAGLLYVMFDTLHERWDTKAGRYNDDRA